MTIPFVLSVLAITAALYLLGRFAWWAIGWIIAIKVSRGIASFSIELASLRMHKRLCEQLHQQQKVKEAGGNRPLDSHSIH